MNGLHAFYLLLGIVSLTLYELWRFHPGDAITTQKTLFLNSTCNTEVIPMIVFEEPTRKPFSFIFDPVDETNTKLNATYDGYRPTPFLKEFGVFGKNQYDYKNIKYPVPFNTLFSTLSIHYARFGKVNSIFPEYVLTGYLPVYANQRSDVLLMTGASDNHGYGSFNCLYSMLLADPYASILYVDYGLSPKLLSILAAHFESLHMIQEKVHSDGFLAYRRFNWKSFPEWMHLKETNQRGGYSWKMVAVYDAFVEWKGFLSWLDGGNVIVDGLSREITAARHYGVYSPISMNTVGKWVHKDMKQFVLKHKFVRSFRKNRTMGSGGVLFIDYSKKITHKFMEMLVECCYTQQCVAPKKASIANHRQDQSILTLLLHEFHIPRAATHEFDFHPSLRNDGDNDEQITKPILENLMVALQHTYHAPFTNKVYNTSDLQYREVRMLWVSRPLHT